MRRAADALVGLDGRRDPLGLADDLRRRLAGPLAQRAAELHDARHRALGRFPGAESGFFTRKGVEQMTRAPVAAVRAAWILERLGRCTVLDATCGVGGDSVALAAAGLTAISMDRAFGTVLCASENLRALALPDRTLVGDACHPPLGAPFGIDVLLLDPDRRPDGARTADPRGWSPTLEQALAQAIRYRGACIKLPPAIDPAVVSASFAGLSAGEAPAWSLSWIEADGELCEVSLWTGELAQGPSEVRAALVLGSEPLEGPARIEGVPEEVPWLAPDEAASIRWLAEPGPAVVRSGLFGLLARRVGMAPLGPGIGWLGGPERPDSPFLGAWRVLDSSTADPRRVRAMLARHDVGPVAVWKRGHPERPEVLERRLRGRGARPGLLAIARLERGHAAYLLDGGPGVGPGGAPGGDKGGGAGGR